MPKAACSFLNEAGLPFSEGFVSFHSLTCREKYSNALDYRTEFSVKKMQPLPLRVKFQEGHPKRKDQE